MRQTTRILTALAALLVFTATAFADNYYYRDRKGPELINLGNGQFELTYLTYDYSNLDDYLKYMNVAVKVGDTTYDLFRHFGDHGNNGGPKYGLGFGKIEYYQPDIKVESINTRSSGDECYRTVRVSLPERFWGSYRVNVSGTFCYEWDDPNPLEFNYDLNPSDLGSPRFSNSPTLQSVVYAYPRQISISLDNVQCVKGATTTLKTYIDEILADTRVFNDGTLSGARTADYSFEKSNFDGGKEHNFKVVTEISFAGRISTSNVTQSMETYAVATNLKSEFNTVTRANSLSWEIENPGEYDIYGVSVQRCPYGSSPWTEIKRLTGNYLPTQYTDTDATKGGLQCGKRYEYRVVLLPEIADQSADIASFSWSGSPKTDVTMKPALDINMEGVREAEGATIQWEIPHSSEFEGCMIRIWRSLANGSGKTKIAEKRYSGQGKGSYTDTGIHGVYKYYITLDATGSWYGKEFTSPAVQVQTIDSATVRDFRISKGEYEGIVHLEWDVDNVEPYGGGSQPERTTYTVFRRSLESSDSEFTRIYTVSTNDEYNIWEDKNVRPGIYYEYRLDATAVSNDEAGTKVDSSVSGIGFAISWGKITGTISYGTGTAVPGVDVVALPTTTGSDVTSSRCLEFSGNGSTTLECSAEKLNKLFNDARGFSMQMWINPKEKKTAGNYLLANIGDVWQLQLAPEAEGESFTLAYAVVGSNDVMGDAEAIVSEIPADTYSHLTLTCKDGVFGALVFTPDPQTDTADMLWGAANTVVPSAEITTDRAFNLGGNFCGKIDDFRLWNRALEPEEIESNFNRSLTGSESGLEIYWRFDEGLNDHFFDSSRTGTSLNGNHGTMSAGVTSSTLVPPTKYLSYRAVTDIDGNYMIDGIPFAGEGTAYSVVPTMGIHEFKPNKLLRYIGASSLMHNATDFTDVSSFPVSGKVYYENTTYPVADCTFYIDGVVASRDGKMVTTADDGSFSIDVPIGEHHIEVRKEGHTFASAGRYPEDSDNVGTKHTFDREITGLTFFDTTQVNFAGRVTGGAIEGSKPLGFGQSVNTIGKVRLSLVPQDDRYRLNVVKQVSEASVEYVTNTETLPCASVSSDVCEIGSNAWRGAGDEDRTRIFIDTDPKTGEFSAKLPPLRYVIESAKVLKNDLTVAENKVIDLSNPQIEMSDSVTIDGVKHIYKFAKSELITYHTLPTLKVTDKDADTGAFGLKEYYASDTFGEFKAEDIYTVNAEGECTYRFGHPIFVMGDPYKFQIEGYEEYINADGEEVSYRVPLKDVEVIITNELASVQEVYYEGENAGKIGDSNKQKVTLDETGFALYKWRGGFPNINDPYTRRISMSYTIDGRTYDWSGSGMECYLFGELPTGSNFVTAGPDCVEMVLRDPPGSGSNAEWSKGSITTTTTMKGTTSSHDDTILTQWRGGPKLAVGTGGIGLIKFEETESIADANAGVHRESQTEDSSTITHTYTATRTIATSDAPEFVGSMGDLYIGSSTNINFGNARRIDLHREAADATPEVSRQDVIATGVEYGTIFTYSQFFIENTLLPNFSKLIETKLEYADETAIEGYANNSDKSVYLTPLKPGDKGYGSRNDDKEVWGANARPGTSGPSYWMFAPDDTSVHTDSVGWLNNQIKTWKNTIAMNERDKVEVYHKNKSKYFIHNLSFDGGAKVSYSEQNDTTRSQAHDYTCTVNGVSGGKSGYNFNRIGVTLEWQGEHGDGSHSSESQEETETATFTYNLAEDDWDSLSVDVMRSSEQWSPIFHTRAGQTSAPYEGEERTKYYEPGGYTLNEATMQMEVPRISVENPVATDVPIGSNASYKLLLGNDSECDYDFYFLLLVTDESNPDGAALTLDGQPLTTGRRIKVPAGETLEKTLLLSQTRPDILDYKDIRLVLASEVQNDPTSTMAVIADTCSISAHFVPSSSPVNLKVPTRVINTTTGSRLAMTFDGFDRNYAGLKAMRLQYRLQGSPTWTVAREFVIDEADLTGNNELLPEGGSINADLDTKDMPDGDYLFRMLSVSTYGAEEVTLPSEEIAVVKDTVRPAPISLPAPSNGILGPGEELSVTFSEDILQGYVTADNITLRGRLNDAEVSHDGVFRSSGGEGASTAASIDLSSGSFTFGTWLKWSSAGSLLRHGTAGTNIDVTIDAEGKVKVALAGTEYTSTTSLPKDKWCYLNLAYDRTNAGGELKVDAAYDSTSVNLLNCETGSYAGNGILTVGRGINASIHELTLWNYARDFTKAQSEIHTSKSATTEGLLGYWRLDEGHGSTGTDLARMRHLTLPSSSSWSLEHTNYGLDLDGESYAIADLSEAAGENSQDYLLEFWFKGPASQGDAVMFDAPSDGIRLESTASGLTLRLPEGSLPISSSRYLDDSWHHFALNVLKGSAGSAIVYVDGKALAQTSSARVAALGGGNLVLGARRDDSEPAEYDSFFKGSIDELRVWHATKSAESIRSGMYSKPEAGVSGLAAYFPFEKKGLDQFNQTVTMPDTGDQGANSLKAIRILTSAGTERDDWSTTETTAIKDAPQLQDVRFSFTSSDRKILINLEEDAARVEGCTLEVNLHGIQDAHGNYSLPVNWTAYVSRNSLLWEDQTKSVTMEVAGEASFTANIVNSGSTTQQWSISGLPLWLEADRESGTITPLSSRTLTFKVVPGTSVGRYETIISLSGEDGLKSNLTVNLSVQAERPDWKLDSSLYEYTMNLVGQLKIDGTYSEDPDDLVGAFIDGECRGVVSPVYYRRYDAYYLMLDIYGNAADAGKEIVYKVFDASTGVTLPDVTPSENHSFTQDYVAGTISDPVIFEAVDSREQIQTLAKGWNWISLYVDPADSSPSALFGAAASADDLVKSKSAQAVYSNGKWAGELTSLAPGNMYKVRMGAEGTMQVRGAAIDNAAKPITVAPEWNWIGYDNNFYLGLDEALAGLDPCDGDMIKGREAFAIYMGYEWVGSLNILSPGSGYIYRSESGETKSFSYPTAPSSSALKAIPYDYALLYEYEDPLKYTSCDIHKYQGNMTMVTRVISDGKVIPCEVAVFDASGECRAAARSRGDEDLEYLTIQGEKNGETLTFRIVYKNDEGKTVDYTAFQTVEFSNDGIIGTPSDPFILNPDFTTGVNGIGEDAEDEIFFDLSGVQVKNPGKGVYIRKRSNGAAEVNIR